MPTSLLVELGSGVDDSGPSVDPDPRQGRPVVGVVVDEHELQTADSSISLNDSVSRQSRPGRLNSNIKIGLRPSETAAPQFARPSTRSPVGFSCVKAQAGSDQHTQS